MKIVLLTFAILSSLMLKAQPGADQRIEDSVIGWWNNNRFDKKLKPTTDPVQLHRIAQLDKLIEWMKKSYTPVGGIGTVTRENPNAQYGVRFGVWGVSYGSEWTDEKGHFNPVAEEITPFGIHMNVVPGSYPVPFLNGNGAYYFTWPKDGFRLEQSTRDRERAAKRSFTTQQSKYITRSNEGQIVMLAPGNKLPFIQLTRKEYLDLTEQALRKEAAANMDKGLQCIEKIRKAYAGSLDEPAEIAYMQPTLWNFKNSETDMFGPAQDLYPVYKMPLEVIQKCWTDQPQWIAIWYPYFTSESGNKLYEMYRSITEHLNYDYIYNYFFNPEKVNGVAYKPVDEEGLLARLTAYRTKYRKSLTQVKPAAKPGSNLIMDEDFATYGEGTVPTGWYIRSVGKSAAVVSLPGKTGKWLKLGYNNPATPVNLPKPLPADFNLDFDIATDEHFPGSTGATVILRFSTATMNDVGDEITSPDKQWMEFSFTAGLDASLKAGADFRGAIKAELHNPRGENRENNKEGLYYASSLGQFTDVKTVVHINVRMKGGTCTMLVDGKPFLAAADFKMAYGKPCTTCGLPAGTRFNMIRWINRTDDPEQAGAYIGNIKIGW